MKMHKIRLSSLCLLFLCLFFIGSDISASRIFQTDQKLLADNTAKEKEKQITETTKTITTETEKKTTKTVTTQKAQEKKADNNEKTPATNKARPKNQSENKARVAVLPAQYTQGHRSKFLHDICEKLDVADPSIIENQDYTSFLIDTLVNCRKFKVLERERLNSAVRELDFGESDYANEAKCAEIGQMLNADYVVMPEIRYLITSKEKKNIPYIEIPHTEFEGNMSVRTRIVDVRTSSIVSSHIEEISHTTGAHVKGDSPSTHKRRVLTFISDLYSEVALNQIRHVINAVYPVKIVQADAGKVVINRGEGFIEEGDKLYVYKTGEQMIDPDTGEDLGMNEIQVGKILISRVNPKFAKGKIIEHQESLKRGYICRKFNDSTTDKTPREQEKRVPPQLD